MQAIVDDPLMRHSAVLVFANKQDMVRLLPQSPTAQWLQACKWACLCSLEGGTSEW